MPDRVQQEIEDLLARLEKFPPKRPLRRRVSDTIGAPFRAAGRAFAGLRLPSISAGHLLLIAIAIIVVAYLAGGSGEIVRWVIVAGILLFIAAFVMSLRRHSAPPEKVWRGEPLDLRPRGKSWWGRWRNRR